MGVSGSPGDTGSDQPSTAFASFTEREARITLLVRAMEEEPDQAHIPRERFEEATRIFARSMSKDAGPDDTRVWSQEFLKPRAEWLYRTLVAEHQVYRHFVDPLPFRKTVVWGCFFVGAILLAGLDGWMHFGYVEVVSPLLLSVLVLTWATIAWSVYGLSARGQRDANESLSTKVAAWLSRLFHRLPGARPVSALIVTRFEDLWLRAAAPLVGVRIRVALQVLGIGVIVGLIWALAWGGAVRTLAVHWGTTWFKTGEQLNYGAYRLMTWPGHLAYGVLGAQPMTREEFRLLKFPPTGLKAPAQADSTKSDRAEATPRGSEDDRRQGAVSKWFHTVVLTMLVGALLPRAVLALYLLRRERVLGRSVTLDLSDRYFSELRERTVASLPRKDFPSVPLRAPAARCVWWKPWTWFRPRWPPKFPRLWPPQTPPPELIGDRG
jgi:hypothetical protein